MTVLHQKKTPKKSTFDRYVAKRSAHIEKLIGQALGTIDAAKFGNLTDYCKTLSAIISELKSAKSADANSPYYNKTIKPLSYVTLLRNPAYRQLVEEKFQASRGFVEQQSNVDIDEMKLTIASLFAQTNLLKNKIIAIDSGTPTLGVGADAKLMEIIAVLNERVELLMRTYEGMVNSARGIFQLTLEPTPTRPIAGMYGVNGLIATLDELEEIKIAKKEHPVQP